jgi:thiol:disulfide interchange protein
MTSMKQSLDRRRAHPAAKRIAYPLAVVPIVAFALLVCATARGADLPTRFDPSRDAAADVAQALAVAKAEGKRVIVDVGGEWCSWCHILDRFVASNADVRALIDARYVWVKVNFSKENRNEALLSRWPRIEGYPHLFVLDANGRLVHSQDTSELESGRGYDHDRFVAMLKRFAPPASSLRI